MISEDQVGIQVLNDGANQTLRMTKLAALVVQELHGRYYEQSYRGYTFIAATQVTGAITNLATSSTGLTLANPAGSGRNLVLLDLTIAITTSATANTALGLAANVNPVGAAITGTALPIRSAMLGMGGSYVALAFTVAALTVAPVLIRHIGGAAYSATPTGFSPFIRDEIAGSIVIAPGTSVSLNASAAVSAQASFTWEEVPI